jgi:hypothetical protein
MISQPMRALHFRLLSTHVAARLWSKNQPVRTSLVIGAKNRAYTNICVVPVCTADRIRTVFDSNRTEANLQFEIISNPEFLAEVRLGHTNRGISTQ